jgi:hypothetical protein
MSELDELKSEIVELKQELESQRKVTYAWESKIFLYVKLLEEKLVEKEFLSQKQIDDIKKRVEKDDDDYHY